MSQKTLTAKSRWVSRLSANHDTRIRYALSFLLVHPIIKAFFILKDAPLTTWLTGFRTASLDERMRYEGRGGNRGDNICPDCSSPGTLRCESCFGRELLCRGCCVKRYHRLPLHRIKVGANSILHMFSISLYCQEWNGNYFTSVTLRDIGLRVQLGELHVPGTSCMFKNEVHKDFVILHTNGIHLVNVDSCGCSAPGEPAIDVANQLMRSGWYPATHLEPQTCATFELMQAFHILSLQGKISHYHYYKSLQYLTDNTGIKKLPVSLIVSLQ